MEKSLVKLCLIISVMFCAFHRIQGTSVRLRNALLASGDWLNDVDGDNIPGRAGLDYPIHASVPKETSFRCQKYDYAGYFADVEADCQAYHVCFPDGRNASFLCVNGTVFHQRYYVCDWWFHSNCSLAPGLYELNLYRKIPLPVLPPVRRREFPGPAPQPLAKRPETRPKQQTRQPKNIAENGKSGNDDTNPKKRQNYLPPPPSSRFTHTDRRKPVNNNLSPKSQKNKKDNCNCQCGSNPAAKYVVPAKLYEYTTEVG